MLCIFLAVSALACAPVPALAEKASIPLSTSVDLSTLVCIGTVEGVERVQLPADGLLSGMRPARGVGTFGRIRVQKVLKGDPATTVVYHETWRTWTCDTTTAHEGERCLFFLHPGQVARATEDIRKTVGNALGGAPVLTNFGSGSGILPILRLADGQEGVKYFHAPIEFQFEDQQYHQRLGPMVQYIEALVRFSPDRVVVHAQSHSAEGQAQWKAFDLRILADGSVRTSTGSGTGESVRIAMLDNESWAGFRSSIVRELRGGPIEFGDPERYRPYRLLRVTLPDARLSFVDDHSVIVSALEGADLERYRSALRVWALVRARIECDDCADSRKSDEAVLGR